MARAIDLQFVGEKLRRLHTDGRDVTVCGPRRDAAVPALHPCIDRPETAMALRHDAHDGQVAEHDRRCDRHGRQLRAMRAGMARNQDIVLTAIGELRG